MASNLTIYEQQLTFLDRFVSTMSGLVFYKHQEHQMSRVVLMIRAASKIVS